MAQDKKKYKKNIGSHVQVSFWTNAQKMASNGPHVYFTETSLPILCASSDTYVSIYEIATLHWLLKPAFVKPRTCNIIGQGRDNVQTKWSVMKTFN